MTRSLPPRRNRERELEEELEGHLRMATQDREERGQASEEARVVATREFGNAGLVAEVTRDAWGGRWFDDLLQDARYGLRTMRRSLGFSAAVIVTLALGIGANTAIFSLVNGILLRSLPYENPQALVSVTGTYPKGAFVAMREQMRTMDVAAYSEGHGLALTGMGEPVQLNGTLVSAECFSLLGAQAELGQTFRAGADRVGQDNFVVLSHGVWTRRFGSDPSVIGRLIELDGVGREVLGVMPPDFRFPSDKTEVWIPLRNDPRNTVSYWADDFMPVIGRLRAGARMGQAHEEIRRFQSQAGALFPWTMPANWNADVSVVPLREGMVADIRLRLLILQGAVVLVLLVACSNVANLMLSRAAKREKEISVRSALGASRLRIVRQMLVESVLLGLAGGALGLALGSEGLRLLKRLLPADTPRLAETQLDWGAMVFTAGLAVATGFLFGVAPALRLSRARVAETIQRARRGTAEISRRLRSVLVVAQVTLAVLLVITAGLLIRTFWTLSHADPGFRSEHVLTARVIPPRVFCGDATRCLNFYENVLSRALALPGISGAAAVNTLPLSGRVSKRSLDLEGYVVPPGETSPLFWLNVVTADYFRVMGMHLLAGRGFEPSDAANNARVAILSVSSAKRYWHGENVVGKHLRFVGENDWRTVVGVIADARAYDLQNSAPNWIEGTVYVPYNSVSTLETGQVPEEMTIAMRTGSDLSQEAGELRKIVAGLSPETIVGEVKTMNTVLGEAEARPRSTATLFAIFAAVALSLGMIGVYGVLSYLVANRTGEIAIRMALGAQRREVLWSVVGEGAKLSFAGIALGAAGALALKRVLSSELYGASGDVLTFVGVSALVAAISLIACWIPAWRAMHVEPVVALRYE